MTHPSSWRIKKASAAKHCQTLKLPLGPDKASYIISVQLFNKIYHEWDSATKSYTAGDFAQALRDLRTNKINLSNMEQVNAQKVEDCYAWLEQYELEISTFAVKHQAKVKAAATSTKPATQNSQLHDQIFLIAVKEYTIMAGPMGDARQIAEKAKAVATACTTED